MLATADLAETTLPECVLFDLAYLKIKVNEFLLSFFLAFCFQISTFASFSLHVKNRKNARKCKCFFYG